MSTKRKGKWGPRGTGPNGRKLCYCGCGEELPVDASKRSTSIPGHYQAWAARNDPNTVRRLVEQRDRGVCAGCGVDTWGRGRAYEEHKPLWRWLAQKESMRRLSAGEFRTRGDAYEWELRQVDEQLREKFGVIHGGAGHLWEADHIVPVCEGGGECDLSNYRTLCIPCHKAATAALAKRRAERRRPVPNEAQITLSL